MRRKVQVMNGGESLPVEVGQEGAALDLATEKYETILVLYADDVQEQKVTCKDRQKKYLSFLFFNGVWVT